VWHWDLAGRARLQADKKERLNASEGRLGDAERISLLAAHAATRRFEVAQAAGKDLSNTYADEPSDIAGDKVIRSERLETHSAAVSPTPANVPGLLLANQLTIHSGRKTPGAVNLKKSTAHLEKWANPPPLGLETKDEISPSHVERALQVKVAESPTAVVVPGP